MIDGEGELGDTGEGGQMMCVIVNAQYNTYLLLLLLTHMYIRERNDL